MGVSHEYGFTEKNGYPQYGTAKPTSIGLGGVGIIGVKSIAAYLGGYRIVFANDVEAFWGFNEESELIYVQVRKTVDSL